MSRIHLKIDRLVLRGLEAGQEKALAESLRAQLSQVLSDPAIRGEWARSHRTPVVRLGQLPIDPGNRGARKFGAQLARGIGRGLKG